MNRTRFTLGVPLTLTTLAGTSLKTSRMGSVYEVGSAHVLCGNIHTANAIAYVIVALELAIISWIRNHYMDTPFLSAAFQVIVGGLLVFFAGIFIGSA